MFLPSGHHCTCLFKELFPPILLHWNNDIPVLEFLPRKFPGLNGIIKYAELSIILFYYSITKEDTLCCHVSLATGFHRQASSSQLLLPTSVFVAICVPVVSPHCCEYALLPYPCTSAHNWPPTLHTHPLDFGPCHHSGSHYWACIYG